jgi:hypothetical protein
MRDSQRAAMPKIFKAHGTGPTVVKSIAKAMQLTEAEVSAVAGIFEAGGGKRTNFESGDASGTGSISQHQVNLATELKATVDRAEARESLKDCSLQELEALTAARFAR